MWRTNANTIEGERARTASQLLLFDGFCKKETEAGRDVFFGEKYGETPHRAGSGCLTRQHSDARTANSLNRASFWSASITSGTYIILMHGLFGLSVDFFLHDNEVLKRDRDCDVVGAQVHRLKKRERGKVLLLRLFLLLYHHVLPPESPVPLAPRTRCGRLGASKEKKSVGSWFHAESASPFGGELS